MVLRLVVNPFVLVFEGLGILNNVSSDGGFLSVNDLKRSGQWMFFDWIVPSVQSVVIAVERFVRRVVVLR
mgnify:CR=1 FL=1